MRARLAVFVAIAACSLGLIAPAAAGAQTTPADRGKLVVTIADQTGGVIPNAPVIVTRSDAPAGTVVTPIRTTTSPVGIATIEDLAPGRYTIQAEYAGFETTLVRDARVRAGENKRTITLPLKKMSEEVTVGRDPQTASLDPQGSAFSTVLTREQIARLPDDPDEMAAVLQAMSPPGSTIRVDGFTGGRLPPKSQIRSIRLPRIDQYAAQNHGGAMGLHFIDISTQPGNGPVRGTFDATFRDDGLNARNPFLPVKGLERLKQGGISLSGTVVPNKSSFVFSAQRADQIDEGNVFAAVPGALNARPVFLPTTRMNYTGRFDQAITPDHLARFSYTRSTSDRRNLGVGAYDLQERAYESSLADNVFRVSENGPLGRRFFSESRLQVHWSDSQDRSLVEAQTFRVLDSFTSGGAQRSGGRRVVDFEAATDLDYVKGAHSYRAGALVEGGRYRSNDSSNYLGTFTFSSLADFDAGRASNFTRRIGDPNLSYSNIQAGVYLQDDYRVARSVLLSYGLRYETQSLIEDQNNFSPRATITWSPFKDGKTTLRAGWGFFPDWLGVGVYEQTLRFDGTRQQEINILNPQFPEAGSPAVLPPTNRYLLSDGLQLPESMSANLGLDRTFGSLRLSAAYTHRRGSAMLRGRNLNALENGARPDPSFANVIEVVDDAESRTNLLNVNANFILLNWHSTFFAGNYTLGSTRTNSTGAFSPPSNGDDLAAEWGQTVPRHRAGAMFSTQPIRDLSVSLNVRVQSGAPYNITTGIDTNRDGLFSDRPADTERNSARTTAQWDLGLRVSYAIGFGSRQAGGGGTGAGPTVVVMGGGTGGGQMGGLGGGATNARYRIEFYGSASNLTNHSNLIGYSGVMTSPFFGQPTNAMNPRKVELGMRFGF